MTRLATGTVLLLAVLALAACGGSKKSGTTATTASANGKPVALTLWTGFTAARARRDQERRRRLPAGSTRTSA